MQSKLQDTQNNISKKIIIYNITKEILIFKKRFEQIPEKISKIDSAPAKKAFVQCQHILAYTSFLCTNIESFIDKTTQEKLVKILQIFCNSCETYKEIAKIEENSAGKEDKIKINKMLTSMYCTHSYIEKDIAKQLIEIIKILDEYILAKDKKEIFEFFNNYDISIKINMLDTFGIKEEECVDQTTDMSSDVKPNEKEIFPEAIEEMQESTQELLLGKGEAGDAPNE